MKISVLTGSRADYGLLRWLMREINESPDHELITIATGSHISEEHGSSLHEIIKDGFEISATVNILMHSDSGNAIAKSTGLGFLGFSDIFTNFSPDLLVVLGDRYEAFAAVSTAFLMNIPVAHIAGGEVTEGALDDGLRHAMTKMSTFHFPSTKAYARRIMQLGEDESHIFVVGATGLDSFENIPALTMKELETQLKFKLTGGPLALCTFHPETAQQGHVATLGVSPLLEVLSEKSNLRIIFTMSNADEGGAKVNSAINEFVSKHPERTTLVPNLGVRRYINLLKIVDLVLGNSSSGITEAPTAGTVTVNIGDRQQGRLRAPSVIDVDNTKLAISQAIDLALSDEMRNTAKKKQSPFGSPGASSKIFKILSQIDLKMLGRKSFIDRI